MSASTYVGRIGALAAAFGVGAAIFTGPAIAWADPTADTSGTSAPDSQAGSQSAGDTGSTVARGKAARAAHPARSSQPSSKAGDSTPETGIPTLNDVVRDLTPRRSSDSAESAPQQSADLTPSPAAATAAKGNNSSPAAAATTATATVADTEVASPAPAAAVAPEQTVTAPAPAASRAVTSVIETATTAVAPKLTVTSNAVTSAVTFPAVIANVANHISTVINSVVSQLVSTFSGNSPFAPQVDSPANWLLLAAARRTPLASAATGAAVAATPATPTLVLNGFGVVPDSAEIISAFTGRWAYWPGQPNMQQGSQDFALVNLDTAAQVGHFSALVTAGDPTSLGAKYVEMLVTANDGTNVGTGAGQTPPVGTVLGDFTIGMVGFSYSSMPSPSGDVVTVKLRTPLGSIPLPLTYDASKGIVDHTFDNRPMDITGGFSIAPSDPAAEKITGAIGTLPLFNSLQGKQKFSVYDSNGNKVGNFDGLFTTTSDTLGIYTQEIKVTANDGINVGTQPGQTPPVGTVYNVAYFGNDKTWLLYSAMPQASGAAITLKLGTPKGVTDLTSLGLPHWLFPQTTFNAAVEPDMTSMVAPGGQKFVPTTSVIPAGVNGLPPRDMQLQGYQQFDVYDFLGRKIGTIDADVENQWDSSSGPHAKSILITKVTSGDAGTTPLNVPPVGTVMNFIDFGNGFAIADSVIPQKATNLNSFMFVTPLGSIPLLPSIVAATHPEVSYVNPF